MVIDVDNLNLGGSALMITIFDGHNGSEVAEIASDITQNMTMQHVKEQQALLSKADILTLPHQSTAVTATSLDAGVDPENPSNTGSVNMILPKLSSVLGRNSATKASAVSDGRWTWSL